MGALNEFHNANWQAMWDKIGRHAPLTPVFAAVLCMPPIGDLATLVLDIEAKTNVDETRVKLLETHGERSCGGCWGSMIGRCESLNHVGSEAVRLHRCAACGKRFCDGCEGGNDDRCDTCWSRDSGVLRGQSERMMG